MVTVRDGQALVRRCLPLRPARRSAQCKCRHQAAAAIATLRVIVPSKTFRVFLDSSGNDQATSAAC